MIVRPHKILDRAMFKLILVFLLLLISLESIRSECISLEECPAALKYINNRRYDPETIQILQKAHCAVVGRRAKVDCNKIPDFEVITGCVYYHECPKAQNLERNKESNPLIAEMLSSAACGYNGRKDMIKCFKLSTSQRGVNSAKHSLLPSLDECGIQTGFKIFGGERAELEDLPWLALLKNRNSKNQTRYQCHGTLISRRYVLTAAHCFYNHGTTAQRDIRGNLSEIILGEYNTDTTEDCLQGYCADPIQVFKPESIHVHPNFLSLGALSDIALIRLDRDVIKSDYVKPICLPLRSITLHENEFFMIGGWGLTEHKRRSNIKLKAKVNYLTKEACMNKYSLKIDDTQVCAGSKNGSDTCKGDSGGPLMAFRKGEDREVRNFLVGVVSYGGICGTGAGVYTNVSGFLDWILETIHE